MISFASAADWDNSLRYEKDDMKVTIENWAWIPFFGDDLGTVELKSHKSVNEVLKVAPGNNRVVMYYDFDFDEVYENGLGDVEFINMTDGEVIEKDYHFVIWDTFIEEKNNYSTVCNEIINATGTHNICQQIFKGTYTEEVEGWVRLDIKDIPKGKARIGLATDVDIGETIDGIWTVAGKKIKKHAVWTADLNTNLIYYYKLNETTGDVIDSVGNYNGTNNGATRGVDGIINNSFSFITNDYVNSTNIAIPTDESLSVWFKTNSTAEENIFIVHTNDGGAGATGWGIAHRPGSGGLNLLLEGTAWGDTYTSVNDDNWHFAFATKVGTTYSLYIDGSETVNSTLSNAGGSFSTTTLLGAGSSAGLKGFFEGEIDEVGHWNISLNATEVSPQLYNGGVGITYINQFGGIVITLNSPEDNFATENNTIIFNASIVELNSFVVSVSLLIDGVINETNSSGDSGLYTFEKSLSFGNHNWSISVLDNETDTTNSDTRSFSILDGSLSSVWTNEYQVRIIAANLIESDFEINNVVVTQESSNLWKINTSEGDYEVARAQVMKTFFYGTDGSNPRINRTTGLLKVQTIDTRDVNKRGVYATAVRSSIFNSQTYTGTFVDTTNNTDCSSWSYVDISTGSDQEAFWEIPSGTLRNGITSVGTSDETGTDTTIDEVDNPANSQLQAKGRPGFGGVATVRSILFCVGNVTWVDSGLDTAFNIDFTVNESVPITSPMPNITLNSPEDNLQDQIGNNITFNITSTITGGILNEAKLFIDGILNETQSISGTENTTIFTKSFVVGNYNWSVEVCDTNDNCALSETRDFVIDFFKVNSITFNSTSFETASEKFIINVTGVTSSVLIYNGTEYTTTKSGDIFTRTIQMPLGELGNHSVRWVFDGTGSSTTSYQNVSETTFTLCNATYSTTFLNVSFKDESDSSVINASIPTSTFDYWLGDGTEQKTYTYINNTDNFNYEFCATPTDLTLNTDIYIQYKQGSDYPQRTYDAEETSLTNATTNLTLYLLEVDDGLYVTFQVFGGRSNALQDVDVSGTRVISGSTTTVAQGTTDASGIVTFWINPDFQHRLTFIKTGYETLIETLTPTQTLYTITMGTESETNVTDNSEGVVIIILPQGSFLDLNTFYTFKYIINSSVLDLDEFGFELFYNNGTSIYSDTSTTSTGGTLDKSFNTSNQSRITMDYYYIINSTRTNGTTYWLIYDANDFSIYHFLTRVGTYISADMFGILGDDEGYFAKAILSITILILVTGSLSFKYGIASEAAVTGLLFGVVFMLNTFNLIPTPDFLNFIELGNFLVFLLAIFTIVSIFKEAER